MRTPACCSPLEDGLGRVGHVDDAGFAELDLQRTRRQVVTVERGQHRRDDVRIAQLARRKTRRREERLFVARRARPRAAGRCPRAIQRPISSMMPGFVRDRR